MANKDLEEKEENKLGMAAGGLTEQDEKLIQAFHELNLTPHIETSQDLLQFMTRFGKAVSGQAASTGSHSYPKLSIFYGEDNKGEATWETFRYEIDALLSDKTYTKEQILLGLRRAVKGIAADILRRLGPGVTLEAVLQKFQSIYGTIESKESILSKFYSSQQLPKETITLYSTRLEEIYSQAVTLGALPQDDTILQRVLYHGLTSEIKHMATYKNDVIHDYDMFKIELRKIEADLTSTSQDPCHAQVNIEKKPSELGEVKELLQKLNDRIEKIEKQQEDMKQSQGQFRQRKFRRQKQGGNYRQDGHSQVGDRKQRPLGSMTFTPTCFGCNGKGHMVKDCPNAVRRQCYNCQQYGHIAKDCPN